MSSCAVCLNTNIKSPVILPCGHVFCHDCASRAIQSVKPSPTQHWKCPNCRHPYQIIMVDTVRLPAQLFPHVFPRPPKINSERPTPIENATPRDPADLTAENEKLRTYCAMWRRRAEAHAAATLGVLNIAHTARQEALRIKIERDELQTRYNALKRKEEESELCLLPGSLLFANDGPSYSPTPSSLVLDEEEEEDFKPFGKRRKTESPETPSGASVAAWARSQEQFFPRPPEPGDFDSVEPG